MLPPVIRSLHSRLSGSTSLHSAFARRSSPRQVSSCRVYKAAKGIQVISMTASVSSAKLFVSCRYLLFIHIMHYHILSGLSSLYQPNSAVRSTFRLQQDFKLLFNAFFVSTLGLPGLCQISLRRLSPLNTVCWCLLPVSSFCDPFSILDFSVFPLLSLLRHFFQKITEMSSVTHD